MQIYVLLHHFDLFFINLDVTVSRSKGLCVAKYTFKSSWTPMRCQNIILGQFKKETTPICSFYCCFFNQCKMTVICATKNNKKLKIVCRAELNTPRCDLENEVKVNII